MTSTPPLVQPVPIIEGENLTKHFGGRRLFVRRGVVRAVDGVSLSVAEGETFAIVGESGCGKSTLGRLLLRLIEPSAGTVRFRGRDITRLASEEMRRLRREMQIVFQDPYGSLNPRMTIGALVGEPLTVHGLATGRDVHERIVDILSLVGLLPEHMHRYPHEFSGGQRQRIAIARALAAGPKLVLGDEPVSALDVSVRAQIINLLEDLKAQFGLTVILVAHDLAVIRHTSDRVAVMYLGEIVETAPAARLFETPRHPYTQALLAAIPTPSPRARRDRPLLEGDPPSPANPPPGCRFHTRCPHARSPCKDVKPESVDLGGGHAVSCHRVHEIGAAGAGALNVPPTSDAKRRRLGIFTAARSTGAN